MTTLASRAAELARPAEPADATPGAEPATPPAPVAEPYELPDHGIPEPDASGPDQVPVHIAWSRVMGTIGGIAKARRVTEGPAKFDYRGVDEALNVFGPACRLHGVLVLPVRVEAAYRDTKTSTGKATRECTVIVTYRIIGPQGDHLEVQAAGESLDTQDKGSAKAQAVALRTLLFHAGLVPVKDPDSGPQIERGESPVRPPSSYRDEALDPRTTFTRLRQIHTELTQHRIVGAIVENEVGDEEPIGKLVVRIGTERRAAEAGES